MVDPYLHGQVLTGGASVAIAEKIQLELDDYGTAGVYRVEITTERYDSILSAPMTLSAGEEVERMREGVRDVMRGANGLLSVVTEDEGEVFVPLARVLYVNMTREGPSDGCPQIRSDSQQRASSSGPGPKKRDEAREELEELANDRRAALMVIRNAHAPASEPPRPGESCREGCGGRWPCLAFSEAAASVGAGPYLTSLQGEARERASDA
jgi:hypothetical protein